MFSLPPEVRSGFVAKPRVRSALFLGSRLLVLGFLAGGVIQTIGNNESLAAIDLPGQTVALAIKDGLLTATFSDRTDDETLNAAIPGLVAKGVQAVSLRGAPVRNVTAFSGMAGLKGLDICGT